VSKKSPNHKRVRFIAGVKGLILIMPWGRGRGICLFDMGIVFRAQSSSVYDIYDNLQHTKSSLFNLIVQ
jgi:hypothetical protein